MTQKKANFKLRMLLLRVWFAKNWFTIFVIIVTILLVFTFLGLIPETVPLIGNFSHYLKGKFQDIFNMDETDNATYVSLFGSFGSIFSIIFSLGYLSNKIKIISYDMIDKKKLEKLLKYSQLSINDKGVIVKIEEHVNVDLDGDSKIGSSPSEIKEGNNIIGDAISTVSEFITIMKIEDSVLEQINDAINTDSTTTTTDVAEVKSKKAKTPYKPTQFK